MVRSPTSSSHAPVGTVVTRAGGGGGEAGLATGRAGRGGDDGGGGDVVASMFWMRSRSTTTELAATLAASVPTKNCTSAPAANGISPAWLRTVLLTSHSHIRLPSL